MDSRLQAFSTKKKRLSAEGVGARRCSISSFTPPPSPKSTPSPSPTGSKKRSSLVQHNTKLAVFTGSRRRRNRSKTDWKKRRKYRTRREKRRVWTKKERRAFHRALSGIKVTRILNQPLRIMTLTSAQGASWENLNNDFEKLKKRIRRESWKEDKRGKKGKKGKKRKKGKNGKGEKKGKGVKFEYFKVKTNEGYGVLHILYRGTYIPQKWLSETWAELHGGSFRVYLQFVRWGEKRLARYVVSQYIAGQSFTRQSWSWRWVFRGFVRVWKGVVKRCRREGMKKILAEWDKTLPQHCFKQVCIYEYLAEHPPPCSEWVHVTDEWWRNVRKKRGALK